MRLRIVYLCGSLRGYSSLLICIILVMSRYYFIMICIFFLCCVTFFGCTRSVSTSCYSCVTNDSMGSGSNYGGWMTDTVIECGLTTADVSKINSSVGYGYNVQ